MGSSIARAVISRGAGSPHGHGRVMVSMSLALLLPLLGVTVNLVNAQSDVRNIVSRTFFDSLLNYTPSGVGSIISQTLFDGLAAGAASSCEGKGFYTYNAFIAAANVYSGFGTTGSDDVKKRELAAFLAHVMFQTGELCYINEVNPSSIYCDQSSSTEWPCKSGKSYHGRGPLQISWNYNYGPAGQSIGFDGLNNPEKVGQDPTISFKTALWFWMTSKCHSAITSGKGFGATIEVLNSMECNGGDSFIERSRGYYYATFCRQLGIDMGTNVTC